MVPSQEEMMSNLIKHPVSKTQQLPEEVEPAVQEGKEAEQKEHCACDRK